MSVYEKCEGCGRTGTVCRCSEIAARKRNESTPPTAKPYVPNISPDDARFIREMNKKPETPPTAKGVEEIAARLIERWDGGFDRRTSLETLIAQALTQARLDALEEAAEFCEYYHAMGAQGLADGIRALKERTGG